MKQPLRLILGISGASGAIYAKSLIGILATQVPGESDLILSPAALRVYREEVVSHIHSPKDYLADILETKQSDLRQIKNPVHTFSIRAHQNIGDRAASGSNYYSGMIIIPCSMNTLGSIAAGLSDNLITRAADVSLKEKRKLILVTRETPLSGIHLQNMQHLSNQGAVILPANPGFYHLPKTIEDLVDFISYRVLQQFNIFLGKGWQEAK